MRRIQIFRVSVLLLFAVSSAREARAQATLPGKLAPAPTQNAQSLPADPLGRETPHGAVMGFLRAAQEENWLLAAEYFQPAPMRRHGPTEQRQELAQELNAILNQKFGPFLDSLSRDSQGRLDDGLPANQEKVGNFRGENADFQLLLVRQPDDRGSQLWYISRPTLEDVPRIYDSLRLGRIEKKLPRVLVENRPLAMPLWQWLAILAAMPIAFALGWFFALLGKLALKAYRGSRGLAPLPHAGRSRFGPGALLIAILFHYIAVYLIGASLLYRQYYSRAIWILLVAGFYWAVTRTTKILARHLGEKLSARGKYAERTFISLVRRTLNAIVLVFVILVVLKTLGVNVTAALAGIGIGGLAIGLGAQKTFENLLGGISILSDGALQVGDVARIGDQTGVVEDIGLRSTKIRTADRTLVSIPNGTVATATLENYRWRDKILSKHTVRLRYDLAPDHVRYILGKLKETLENNPKIEPGSSRVRLVRFADFAFEAEVFAYILERDYNAFLVAQEQLLLSITEVVEKSGTTFASSQAALVVETGWKRPEASPEAVAGGPGPSRKST